MVTFDRAEYIRARAEAVRKPAPVKATRVKAPRIKVYRTDRCSCGRIPIGAGAERRGGAVRACGLARAGGRGRQALRAVPRVLQEADGEGGRED